jgi:UV DNA damage endonuclease
MSIGLVCHYVEKKFKKNGTFELTNLLSPKTFQLGRYRAGFYDRKTIVEAYKANIQNVINHVEKIASIAGCFRLSSDMIPLHDIVPRDYWDNDELKELYKKFGQKCASHGLRVVTHPGQFCVISSEADSTVESSIRELEYHSWMFDQAGFEASPLHSINIHLGKKDSSDRFCDVYKRLSKNLKQRLTIENCESVASVVDLKKIHDKTGIPVVFDSHHHTFKDGGLSLEAAFNVSLKTWNGIKPLQHVSNSEPGKESGNFMDRRKHSELILKIPEPQFEALQKNQIDLEFEAKHKNLAIEHWLSNNK